MEFKNLKVYQPDGSFRTGSLTISGDRISAAEPTAEAVDMGGLYAVPGSGGPAFPRLRGL